jgi:alpha-galactosidase
MKTMRRLRNVGLYCGPLMLALAMNASAAPLAVSNAIETVNLQDLGLNRAKNFIAGLKPSKTTNNKVPSLGGTVLTNAFGSLGNCILSYQLKGQSLRLTGVVGIDDSVATTFTEFVDVIVYGDNKKLWESGPLRAGGKPVPVDVDLRGVQFLELVADIAGEETGIAQTVWSNMAITYAGFRPVHDNPRNTVFDGKIFVTPANPETPRITGGRLFGVRPGSPFLFTVTASGRKPMTFSARSLPEGLQLDPQTGRITGVLRTAGEHVVQLSARNELGLAERELKIVVGDQLALSPPMGWNSWNVHLKSVDQQKVERAAELLVSLGLKDHGYLFVNIDDGWQGTRGGKENALQPNDKFPDMKGLCDKIHSLGLKAGIYHTPWMTSFGSLPGGTAATPDGKWSKDKKEFKVGPYSFLNQDARLWGEWGMDFCKWDWFPHKPEEIVAVAEALRQSGRDMVCKLSNRAVIEHAQTYVKHANSWRTTNDLLSSWLFLQTIAFGQDRWAEYGGPGHWLDLDSLLVGHAWTRPPNLTPDEQYLNMSMWALMSAPLWLSCELEKLDEFSLRMLTNDEVLEIDQDPLGKPARRKWRQGHLEAWVKELHDGSKAVGFFNRAREPLEATIDLATLGMMGNYQVRDLWKRADVGSVEGQITINPAPHGVQLYRMTRRNL